MTSKLVVNTIEADTGISSVSFASSISMNSTAKFHFSAAGVDIGADTNINRPAAGVLGFNIGGAEKLRIDTNGHLNTSGIVTAANFKSGVTNVHNLGVTLTGGQLDVGSNIKIGTAGVVTATSFVGSGANLTSLPAQATLSNNADNRVITGGSGTNLNGEADFTYDGDNCIISRGGNSVAGLTVRNVNNSQASAVSQVTVSGGDNSYAALQLETNGQEHKIYQLNTGHLGIENAGVERLRIDSSGRVVVGGTSAYNGGAALAVLGTSTTPNTYGSFAIGKVGANPTAGTTLANIRLNGGSVGTRRGAEINAVANSAWSDGSSHPTKLTFAVANVNSASATQRFEINHYGHMIFTNENVLPASGSPGTNGFKGLTQLGYQHWGHRQYYSGQQNLSQNGYFNLFSNNTAHDDIIFWLNIKGYHGNRTFATAHGTIGGYGMSVAFQSATGVYGSFSGVNIGSGREQLRWTSTSPYAANWWIWGWYSGTVGTGTHTGWSAAQLH